MGESESPVRKIKRMAEMLQQPGLTHADRRTIHDLAGEVVNQLPPDRQDIRKRVGREIVALDPPVARQIISRLTTLDGLGGSHRVTKKVEDKLGITSEESPFTKPLKGRIRKRRQE